jgi:hypothetical protein
MHGSIGEDLKELIGKEVVVDTEGPLVYIGTLADIGRGMLILGEVDVHDMRDGLHTTTREVYIMQCRRHGIQANRDGARVPLEKMASISLLSEVRLF